MANILASVSNMFGYHRIENEPHQDTDSKSKRKTAISIINMCNITSYFENLGFYTGIGRTIYIVHLIRTTPKNHHSRLYVQMIRGGLDILMHGTGHSYLLMIPDILATYFKEHPEQFETLKQHFIEQIHAHQQ